MTHHTDAGQRCVKLAITGRTAAQLTVRAPADGHLAPPGFYMLFIEGEWRAIGGGLAAGRVTRTERTR